MHTRPQNPHFTFWTLGESVEHFLVLPPFFNACWLQNAVSPASQGQVWASSCFLLQRSRKHSFHKRVIGGNLASDRIRIFYLSDEIEWTHTSCTSHFLKCNQFPEPWGQIFLKQSLLSQVNAVSILCYSMSCCVIQCFSMLFYVILLCYSVHFHSIPCHSMLFCVIWCPYVTLWCFMSVCCFIPWHVILFYVVLPHVMLF